MSADAVAVGREAGDTVVLLRRLLVWLVLLGAIGLLVELLLLDHFESAWQVSPLALLAGAIASAAAVAARPSRRTMRLFRWTMGLCAALGLIGVYLHYRGNVEFELERDPARRGLALFWEAIRGATPALAPAALSQLGLLGLLYSFRHPVLRRSPPHRGPDAVDDLQETR